MQLLPLFCCSVIRLFYVLGELQYILHTNISAFYGSIQIHSSSGIQTNHCRHQHPTF